MVMRAEVTMSRDGGGDDASGQGSRQACCHGRLAVERDEKVDAARVRSKGYPSYWEVGRRVGVVGVIC